MSSEAVIGAAGLGKSYRIYDHPRDRLIELLHRGSQRGTDFWALQDVDLTVRAGEAIGVIGRNGSGKSTLLQLICGLLRPSTGQIDVRGRVAGLLELGAGFNPDFTGRENVHLAAAILGLKAGEVDARFEAIEAFADIGSFIDRPVREYSSGMYARLAFAVCAHVDADILVIDEILAVGDAAFQQKCMRYLRQFQANSGTLLFVSHSEAAVLGLCERAVWLDHGRLMEDGPARKVFQSYAPATLNTGGAFQVGGRSSGGGLSAPRAPSSSPQPEVNLFDFDPEVTDETGEVAIEKIGFFSPDGSEISVVQGRQRLELRIGCKARANLRNPIVAFVVRNKLGRIVFGDDTDAKDRNLQIDAGQSFSARFSFDMPFTVTGQYSVEVFVFAGTAPPVSLVAHLVDSYFLSVHAEDYREGLADISKIEVKLEIRRAHTLSNSSILT